MAIFDESIIFWNLASSFQLWPNSFQQLIRGGS